MLTKEDERAIVEFVRCGIEDGALKLSPQKERMQTGDWYLSEEQDNYTAISEQGGHSSFAKVVTRFNGRSTSDAACLARANTLVNAKGMLEVLKEVLKRQADPWFDKALMRRVNKVVDKAEGR